MRRGVLTFNSRVVGDVCTVQVCILGRLPNAFNAHGTLRDHD